MVIAALTLRPGTPEDAPRVRELAMAELGRGPSLNRLREILDRYPSALAFNCGELCAFVFGVALSPDIIEMANLLVAESYRDKGLGTRLIQVFEEAVRSDYRTIIVANSGLWSVRKARKRSAVPLYRRLGYREIYSTPDTTLMVKALTDDG